MTPTPAGPSASGGSSSKLSSIFGFGAAVFVVSGNYGVAVFFGLMAAAAIAVTVKRLPSARDARATPPADARPPGRGDDEGA